MTLNKNIHKEGEEVSWKWGRGEVKGVIKKVYFNNVEKEIKGSQTKRKGSEENPAYYIKEDKDKYVLKLHSELVK